MKNGYLTTFQHLGIAPQIFELLPLYRKKSAYWMEFWLVFLQSTGTLIKCERVSARFYVLSLRLQ